MGECDYFMFEGDRYFVTAAIFHYQGRPLGFTKEVLLQNETAEFEGIDVSDIPGAKRRCFTWAVLRRFPPLLGIICLMIGMYLLLTAVVRFCVATIFLLSGFGLLLLSVFTAKVRPVALKCAKALYIERIESYKLKKKKALCLPPAEQDIVEGTISVGNKASLTEEEGLFVSVDDFASTDDGIVLSENKNTDTDKAVEESEGASEVSGRLSTVLEDEVCLETVVKPTDLENEDVPPVDSSTDVGTGSQALKGLRRKRMFDSAHEIGLEVEFDPPAIENGDPLHHDSNEKAPETRENMPDGAEGDDHLQHDSNEKAPETIEDVQDSAEDEDNIKKDSNEKPLETRVDGQNSEDEIAMPSVPEEVILRKLRVGKGRERKPPSAKGRQRKNDGTISQRKGNANCLTSHPLDLGDLADEPMEHKDGKTSNTAKKGKVKQKKGPSPSSGWKF